MARSSLAVMAVQDLGALSSRSSACKGESRTMNFIRNLVAGFCLLGLSSSAMADQRRALTLDDFPDHPISARMDDRGWSPDGSKFAYLVYGQKRTVRDDENGAYAGGSDIWVLDTRNGRSSRITDGGPDSSYSGAQWSSDGRQLAFVARKNSDVWLMVWDADTRK